MDELKAKMGEIGVPEKMHKMRATQLFRWIYHYGITDFEAITDINKELRQKLAQNFTLERAEAVSYTHLDVYKRQPLNYLKR